jgi:hypothetical protein
MFHRDKLAFALFLLVGSCVTAEAQATTQEFWPEIGFYVDQGSRTRVVFADSLRLDHEAPGTKGSFTYYLDFALQPVFRRELRQRDDVFRRRFLTFRTGYRYITSLANGESSSENRAIAETTARYPLPGKIVIADRNRGEFRFIKGQGFSMRYRNRLWAERDFKVRRLVLTPYVYDEVFYDTRYGSWNRNRLAAGVQVPVGPHVVVEPYLLRQNDSQSTRQHVHALGLALNLYF